MMEESVYRQVIDDVFRRIDAAYEDVDPDLAESNLSQGTLTIVFHNKERFILSPQAPVRQIWAAFKDQAWHFSHEEKGGQWLDDRGRGVELFGLVEDVTKQVTGETVQVPRA